MTEFIPWASQKERREIVRSAYNWVMISSAPAPLMRKLLLIAPLAILTGFALLPAGVTADAPPTDQQAFDTQVRPMYDKYCFPCHTEKDPSSGTSLAQYKTVESIQKAPAEWRKVVGRIRDQTMPPKNMPQPTPQEREIMALWVAHTLDRTPEDLAPKDPGKVLIRRLSRTEYNNTIRDLFGVDTRPADKFPGDAGGGGGFDNNADTLYIQPILMERYLSATGDILDAAKPDRLFVVRPSQKVPARSAAKQTLAFHATRAYRRPVTTEETNVLLGLYDIGIKQGKNFENAVKFALKGVLISPNFLFRSESLFGKPGPYPIDDYALASRLSYFLWSSMPDEELFRLAAAKKLHAPEVLDAQTLRMLKDPKSASFADSFAGQWLRVRELYSNSQPDTGKFPEFKPALRDAMYQESILFFQSVFQENASLLRLLDANYTYLNEDLAKHYGILNVAGANMRRVALTGDTGRRRGGVLTQAATLTLSSYPQRTSPVLRGKWILSELLGTPPPPPPPVVATLGTDDAPSKEGLTFRQRLEKHREKPECAGCHSRLDPLGFGLENYDAIGRWRDEIGGKPVDSVGAFPNGEKFNGSVELKQYMFAQKRGEFTRHLTEKMLAYALGRGLEAYDAPTVQKITKTLEANNYRSIRLITEIVKSYPFQYRQDAPPPAVKQATNAPAIKTASR